MRTTDTRLNGHTASTQTGHNCHHCDDTGPCTTLEGTMSTGYNPYRGLAHPKPDCEQDTTDSMHHNTRLEDTMSDELRKERWDNAYIVQDIEGRKWLIVDGQWMPLSSN